MWSIILRNRLAILAEKDNFTKCFKTSVTPFWEGNILGFDIVKFEEWMKVPDGISLVSAIQTKYGNEGVRIINELLGIKERN